MKITFTADIHIGNPSTNLQELLACFEQMISTSDMIIVGGDILDAKYHTSSEHITTLLDLMDYITPMIRSTNKILRLIYGTQSHDSYPQLQILSPYTKRMNFKIIPHVTEETIGNLRILYIPEEIITDKQEYYQATLYNPDKRYDYIFGHGTIQEGMPMVKPPTKKVRSTPIFTTEELSQRCTRFTCFGHYHAHWESHNVGYVGSLSRFRHGEKGDKGWYLMENNTRTFIKNPYSPNYTEIHLDCQQINLQDLHTTIANQLSQFESTRNERDKLKFTFQLDRHLPQSINYIDIIRSLCKGDGISYNIHDVNETTIQDEQAISTEFDYILDPNTPIRDKIIKYNDTQFEGVLDENLLDQYLNKVHHPQE